MNVTLTIRALVEVRTQLADMLLTPRERPMEMVFDTAIPTMRCCESLQTFETTVKQLVAEESTKQFLNGIRTEPELKRLVGKASWKTVPIQIQLFSSREMYQETAQAGRLLDKSDISYDIDFMRRMVQDVFQTRGGDDYFHQFLDNL